MNWTLAVSWWVIVRIIENLAKKTYSVQNTEKSRTTAFLKHNLKRVLSMAKPNRI